MYREVGFCSQINLEDRVSLKVWKESKEMIVRRRSFSRSRINKKQIVKIIVKDCVAKRGAIVMRWSSNR